MPLVVICRKLIITGIHRKRMNNGVTVHGFLKIHVDQNDTCFDKEKQREARL